MGQATSYANRLAMHEIFGDECPVTTDFVFMCGERDEGLGWCEQGA